MLFPISPPEVLSILALAVPTLVLYLRGASQSRWWIAATGCLALAAVLTPADLFSALIIAAALFGVFVLGSRQGASMGRAAV